MEDVTPQNTPNLSENECALVNLFRILQPESAKFVLNLMFLRVQQEKNETPAAAVPES
ncbi:MAG: hypothetical protein GXY32_11505 [Ruminococcaceae bacterium]|nr:hypothetical protein [Oscillospiraceae bacterium]